MDGPAGARETLERVINALTLNVGGMLAGESGVANNTREVSTA